MSHLNLMNHDLAVHELCFAKVVKCREEREKGKKKRVVGEQPQKKNDPVRRQNGKDKDKREIRQRNIMGRTYMCVFPLFQHASAKGCQTTFHKSFQLSVPLCPSSVLAVHTTNALEQGLLLTQGLLSDYMSPFPRCTW